MGLNIIVVIANCIEKIVEYSQNDPKIQDRSFYLKFSLACKTFFARLYEVEK